MLITEIKFSIWKVFRTFWYENTIRKCALNTENKPQCWAKLEMLYSLTPAEGSECGHKESARGMRIYGLLK